MSGVSAPGSSASQRLRGVLRSWLQSLSDEPVPERAQRPIRAPAAHAYGWVQVLVADDNPVNLMLVTALMESRGLVPPLATNGAEAVAMACELRFDLILMDINLPGISGHTARALLAADPVTAHIPVIALSANAMPRDIEKGLASGFFRYLTKPIKVGPFMATLDLALHEAGLRTQRRREGAPAP